MLALNTNVAPWHPVFDPLPMLMMLPPVTIRPVLLAGIVVLSPLGLAADRLTPEFAGVHPLPPVTASG
jgi:hypothetical protein